MIAKFILIAVFAHGYGPRSMIVSIGEFNTAEACRAAAQTIAKERKTLDIMGEGEARFICASKG